MEKKEFTFVMLTYNQMQYVVEHLESIKYQVLNYGKKYRSYFLLCDDSSDDLTVYIIKKWIEKEEIFQDIKIIVASQNQGIVSNYITALKNIKTNKFKLLAGDDLYYKNNVYEAAMNTDFLITPTLKVDNNIIINEIRWTFKKYLSKKGHLKEALQLDLKYDMTIETPGIFWDHSFVNNELISELSQYKWCEDLPCWNYLVYLENIKIGILNQPYILYRKSSGISKNENHVRNKEFITELNDVHKNILVNRFKYPPNLNFYRYLFSLNRIFYSNIICCINKHQ